MAADYSSARTLLAWAREDIENLDAACQDFLSDDPCEPFFEDDPETGHKFFKLRMAEVPNSFCKLASHALWDLKHSLDHATTAAVREIRGDLIEDIHFPIGSHPNNLASKLRATVGKGDSREPKYPDPLPKLIESLEPYPTGDGYLGGGDEFVILSRLANTTKHTIRLQSAAVSTLAAANGTGGVIKIFPNWFDREKRELTIGLFARNSQVQMNFHVPCFVAIGNIKGIRDFPVADVLRTYADSIEFILERFAETVP